MIKNTFSFNHFMNIQFQVQTTLIQLKDTRVLYYLFKTFNSILIVFNNSCNRKIT